MPMSPKLRSGIALGVVLAGVAALAIWVATSQTNRQPATPQVLQAHGARVEVPAFAFEDGAGRRRTLADFRGRYVLLNIWATWCVPCREEMPALARLQAKLGGPDFEVLALSIDTGGADAVKRFYQEIGVDALAVYVDSSLQVNSALRVVGVPTSVLLDRQGRELARHVGPAQWDGAQAAESIERLMAR
jgi:thiol-disulfide isomerase/thioredoxin